MKITTINNSFYDTANSLGVIIDSLLYDDMEQHFTEDDADFEFAPSFDFMPDFFINHGAERYQEGDGWDEPITYHLRGDAVSIANSVYEQYTNNATLNIELQKVVYAAVLDEVQANLN